MNMRWTWLVVSALACGGDTVQTVNKGSSPTESDPDETGPVIEHDEITETQTWLEAVDIDAYVTDEEGEVLVVEVWFKSEDTMVWDNEMLSEDGDEGGWSGEIPAEEVESGGMDYFLTAMDDSGNETYFPEEGDSYHFRISP